MIKYLLTFFLWLGLGLFLNAQRDSIPTLPSTQATEYYRFGEEALLNKEYKKAEKLFKTSLKENSEFIAAYRGLAISQELQSKYREAAESYKEALFLNPQFSRAMYYEYALVLYKSGFYAKALEYFKRYERLQKIPIEEFTFNGQKELEIEKKYTRRLAGNIVACNISMDSLKYSSVKTVFNMGNKINTKGDEYFPFLSNNQKTIFYTYRKDEKANEDLLVAKFQGTAWKGGHSIGMSFNTNENEGMTTLVRDGRTVYFTACGREEVKGTCDIWEGQVKGTKISAEKSLQGLSNSERWDSQASISCDGNLLFFASNREGGYGGTDIWMSKKGLDGTWGFPTNLGENVNTPDDEEAPFITNDGKTLYFSSTGHLGMGEQDIFMCHLTDEGIWSIPFNLGPPINTSHRELGFFLSADGKVGYFASNRPEGQGGMDIYNFELSEQLYNEPITLVEGFVKDSTYKLPVQTTIYAEGRDPIVTDALGRFFICLPANTVLDMSVKESNFFPYHKIVGIPEWDNRTFFPIEILLQSNQLLVKSPKKLKDKVAPIEVNLAEEEEEQEEEEQEELYPEEEVKAPVIDKFQYTIYYDFDKYSLTSRVYDELNLFLSQLSRGQIKKVEVIGYADYIGEESYNLSLSEKRAKAVALYLTNRNISVNELFIEGRGEINDGRSPKENRRVDVVIYIKKK